MIFSHAQLRANVLVKSSVGALSENIMSVINVSRGRVAQKGAGGKVLSKEKETEKIPIDPQLLELGQAVDDSNKEVDDDASDRRVAYIREWCHFEDGPRKFR